MVLNYVVTNYSGSPHPAFYYATKVQLFSETTKHFANYFQSFQYNLTTGRSASPLATSVTQDCPHCETMPTSGCADRLCLGIEMPTMTHGRHQHER